MAAGNAESKANGVTRVRRSVHDEKNIRERLPTMKANRMTHRYLMRSPILNFILSFAFLHAQEVPDETIRLELEEKAMTFFQVVTETKKAESLADVEMTDTMREWVQSSNAKSAAKSIERLSGGIGELRKTEYIEHNDHVRSIELFYSGVTQSFKVRVSFSGKQITGFHYFHWWDEQNQYGMPIRLETPTGTIYGSLVEPEQIKTTAVPVVLIVAGSGPTDRNGNQPPGLMCNTYLLLAKALQEHGIASVRYDKRAVSASAEAETDEPQIRFENYVDDVRLWLELLSREKKYSKIIVAGHSEGSLVGMIACSQSGQANGLISLCGIGRPIDEVILEQLQRQSKPLHDSMVPLLDELKQGKTVENVPPELSALVRPSVQPYMISWLKYDPRVEIEKLAIPVLIVQGTTDIRVSLADADSLADANPSAKKTIIKNMDHALKTNSNTTTLFQLLNNTNPNNPLHEELLPGIVSFISEIEP